MYSQGRALVPRPLQSRLWADFFIPWLMLWSQIFRRGQPLPAGSGQVGGPGGGWASLITICALPCYRDGEKKTQRSKHKKPDERTKTKTKTKKQNGWSVGLSVILFLANLCEHFALHINEIFH